MKFKHINLIFSLVAAAFIFSYVTYLVMKSTDLLIGMTFIFALFVVIMGFLLKRMIEQMYDLLVSPPSPGKIIDPFRLIAFGRLIWQYPKEGSFTFMDNENDTISVFEPPLHSSDENHVEVVAIALPMHKNRPGPKPAYSEDMQRKIAIEYEDSQTSGITKETYESLAAKYYVSRETIKDYIKRYKRPSKQV
jgi:hypothetical protein